MDNEARVARMSAPVTGNITFRFRFLITYIDQRPWINTVSSTQPRVPCKTFVVFLLLVEGSKRKSCLLFWELFCSRSILVQRVTNTPPWFNNILEFGSFDWGHFVSVGFPGTVVVVKVVRTFHVSSCCVSGDAEFWEGNSINSSSCFVFCHLSLTSAANDTAQSEQQQDYAHELPHISERWFVSGRLLECLGAFQNCRIQCRQGSCHRSFAVRKLVLFRILPGKMKLQDLLLLTVYVVVSRNVSRRTSPVSRSEPKLSLTENGIRSPHHPPCPSSSFHERNWMSHPLHS